MKYAVALIVFLSGCAVQPPVIDVFMHPGDPAVSYAH